MLGNYMELLLLSLIGGLFSLTGAVALLGNRKLADKLVVYATPFAAGALLAAVFLDLLKDGLEQSGPEPILTATLVGVVLFFYAERFLHWFHHHHQHEGNDPVTTLVVAGDTIHNALDGVAIAAAYMLHPATGIITTIAVAAHEIPQEIGDFGLLLARHKSRRFVLVVNILSSLATVAAALLTYALGSAERVPTGPLIGLSAGFLLYIAASDIIPTIHEKAEDHKLIEWQSGLLVMGVAVVAAAISIGKHLAG